MAQIITSFVDDAPVQVATLRRAVEDGDAPAAQRAAHTMKGSAATIGVNAVARLAEVAEARGRQGSLEGLSPTVDAIETAMDQGVDALVDVLR